MTPRVVVQAIGKSYGRRCVLREVSFTANRGEIVGIIGPNGVGKTTLLRIIAGLARADRGFVRLDGLTTGDPKARCGLGYFAGESTVPPSVRSQSWRRLFQEVDAATDDRPVGLLSRGTRQLLGLRAVFALPALRLILLDEPWEGLDPDASRWLSASMRARRDSGAALLVSSHRLHDLAGVCDRYVFLDDGVATSTEATALTQGGQVSGDALLAAFDAVRGGVR